MAPLPEQRSGAPARAVVTGAGSGRAVAVAFAGGRVVVGITYHEDRAGAEETARQVREASAAAAISRMDLTDLPTSAAVVDRLAGELGGCDVLVNCAGTGTSQLSLDMDFSR